MDRRGEIIVGVVCVVTLVLFAISIFLMSTVNPNKLKTPDEDEDNSNAAVNVSPNSTSTTHPVVTRKGRRSIIDSAASRHLSGGVIIQVLDEEKQTRVEIVLRSKTREKIKNPRYNNKKSSDPMNKSNAAVRVVIDLNQNDLIQIIPDDILEVENILDSIPKENRGRYNMEVLQYSKTDDNYLKNEKIAAWESENNIYTAISEKLNDVGEATETYVYPASVPFTQHAAYFRRNIVQDKKSLIEHNFTSNSEEGATEVRLPVYKTVYMNNTLNIRNHSSKSDSQHATNFLGDIVHAKKSLVEHNVTSNNKKDTADVRLPVNETVYINNTLNVRKNSSKSDTMDDTTKKGDLSYTVKVSSHSSEIINTGGTLHEGNSVNKTSNAEYTVVKDNHATESAVMQNTMNLSSDTINTENTTSKENVDHESFIAEDVLELSNPTSNIFMSDDAYSEDSLTGLNPFHKTVKTEHIINMSNGTSELVEIEETLNNSNLATENIYKEDVVIVTTRTEPNNIENTFNTDKVIANLENAIDNRDPANQITRTKHTT